MKCHAKEHLSERKAARRNALCVDFYAYCGFHGDNFNHVCYRGGEPESGFCLRERQLLMSWLVA